MEKIALLVAEKSVLPVLRNVVDGLRKWECAETIVLAVPTRQLSDFAGMKESSVEVIAEDEVIPGYSLDFIAGRLGNQRARAGWYLQQFVKLGFARIVNAERYVIWDADTVPLGPVNFFNHGKMQVTIAKEYNQAYFDVYERLMQQKPVLRHSAISQYMPVETHSAREMLERIEQIHEKQWIDAVLSVLPLQSVSEFSEYETYANYMASEHANSVVFVRQRWFRHGSDICGYDRLPDNRELERIFSGYSHVAFERNFHSGVKLRLIKAMLMLRMTS